MNEEPSILDYLIARLKFWQSNEALEEWLKAPAAEGAGQPPGEQTSSIEMESVQPVIEASEREGSVGLVHYLPLIALLVALVAQASLEPRLDRAWSFGLLAYLLAIGMAVYANWTGKMALAWPTPDEHATFDPPIRFRFLILTAIFSLAAFMAFQDNRFNSLNLMLWAAAILSALLTFVQMEDLREGFSWVTRFLANPEWKMRFSAWGILLLFAALVAVFFRTYQLAGLPGEMVSDHAEKLYDVRDLLNGQTLTFFPRNTGREFFQMYLTAWVARTFNTGLSFLSLKIGTIALGLLTLPFIYLIGKEIGNRRIGLIAFAFAGIAYWPNLISRIALRFTLYPFFYAPALYFLLRGLRTKKINNYLWAGLFIGLGLNGYSPYRMVPLAVAAMILIYILHNRSAAERNHALFGLVVTGIIAFMVVIPLSRYFLSNPDMVMYRSMTRLTSLERELPGNPLLIFLENNLAALSMFAWNNGEVWVISVVNRPILDIVSGALFHLGAGLILFRYLRKRHWHDLFILVSIPILLLPSTLSIAFPAENPSLNRTAGALIPVFLLVGIGLDGILNVFGNYFRPSLRKSAVVGLAAALFVLSAAQNYDLVFRQYAQVYRESSWNTSELGAVVKDFADLVGTSETAWLVAYPHWVDSRLVMINAGFPDQDNALFPEHFADTQADTRPKLFLINIQDEEDLQTLLQMYPQGWLQRYESQVETKDFWIYIVPPT